MCNVCNPDGFEHEAHASVKCVRSVAGIMLMLGLVLMAAGLMLGCIFTSIDKSHRGADERIKRIAQPQVDLDEDWHTLMLKILLKERKTQGALTLGMAWILRERLKRKAVEGIGDAIDSEG